MIVDDSVVARGFYKRWIDREPDLEFAASFRSGREAIDHVERIDPDIVVLDIEMPDLDGISALPLLLEKKPGLGVIMASTLTRRNAEITLKALSLGALDCIPKPDANNATDTVDFSRELIEKVRGLGRRKSRLRVRPRPAPVREPEHPEGGDERAQAKPAARVHAPVHVAAPCTRSLPKTPPRAIVIGSSTGGPQALTQVVTALGDVAMRVPILITQHMPPTFTTILAEHLARSSGKPVHEARDGEPIVAGGIFVAPGGLHMRVKRRDAGAVIALDDGPQVNFCRPAVDPLFSSAASYWGSHLLGVVLTGMGSDGTHGAADIVNAGGSIIAQDEATSVVWGMPGSVAEAGLCAAILPLPDIAPRIVRLFSGERP
ncbi:MAG: chemotaxis response regulator protein-glutamate methylesterase [Pseudorhodoplanes sp.]|nr:chemotaxis response regulator protein-glutamate methylesterase [Pseudorhodoplanes sp.]